MSDKSDEILKSLGKLKPDEMREIIENLAKQSGVDTPKLAHLPNRLSVEDIVDRASLSDETFYWHVEDTFFECFVDSRDASTQQQALEFAYNTESNQPWYPKSFALTAIRQIPLGPPRRVSAKEFKAWIRKEST